ncbi:MAG: rhomboid family intramembrane serine protease [Planctomycetes bacterium]|nr:rhomboid family intramembrane serine protease [Planctomycetota bacterium]
MDQPSRDRPRTRAGFHARAPAVYTVFTVSGVLYLVAMASASTSALDGLILGPEGVRLEAFFASHLVHPTGLHLVLTMLFLLPAGVAVEKALGTPRFLVFYVFTAWGSTLVTLGSAALLWEPVVSCGAAGVALGCLVAVGVLHPDLRLFGIRALPPLRWLSWIFFFLLAALLAFVKPLPGKAPYFLLPQVSGAAFALGFLWIDPVCASLLRSVRKRREEQGRRKAAEVRQRVDRLLEKISASGYESLTRDEEQFLKQASKYFRR